MTEAEVEKLRAGGISDAIILEMQKDESTAKGQAAPAATATTELPEVDPNTPSRVYSQAQSAGTPTEGAGQTWAQTGAELGGVLIDNAGKIGLGGLGAAGLGAGAMYKRGKGIELETEKLRQQGIQNRFDARAAQQAAQQARPMPVAPGPLVDAQGRPMQMQARPVAPAGAVPTAPIAQAAEQGVVNRAKQVVQQLALSKLAPMATNLLKGANVASLAGYSADLGPKTPQAGRMRGMEINPLTGAPWTPEQIAQYEANPAQYDAQMAPPQFRR
jgi:hypothetical protein